MDKTPNENRPSSVAGASACYASAHDFKEEYYGWRCSKCGVFYPNTAPLGAWLNGETHDGKDNDR